MQTLATTVPEIEQYSIDEAFLNLTGMRNVTTEFAESIVDRVKLWTGIPVSIGIAPTRTLAKVANRQAKMDGVKTCLLLDESKRIDVLMERAKALRAGGPRFNHWLGFHSG